MILVPYRRDHVDKYHEWMKDPALLEATGSEPLSMEEEVEMQKTWRDDETKCTFIVHAREKCHAFLKAVAENEDAPFDVEQNLHGMVGDVNLFLSAMDEDESIEGENDNGEPSSSDGQTEAEIDIMIAENDFLRKGLGMEATCAMAMFAITELSVKRIFCKINEDNTPSLNMFKSLGFVQCNYAECFRQVELELKKPREQMQEIFQAHGGRYKKISCPLACSM